MMNALMLSMARYRAGRVVVHVVAMARDHRVKWHWAGIAREFRHV